MQGQLNRPFPERAVCNNSADNPAPEQQDGRYKAHAVFDARKSFRRSEEQRQQDRSMERDRRIQNSLNAGFVTRSPPFLPVAAQLTMTLLTSLVARRSAPTLAIARSYHTGAIDFFHPTSCAIRRVHAHSCGGNRYFPRTNAGDIEFGHGTHVAGILAGNADSQNSGAETAFAYQYNGVAPGQDALCCRDCRHDDDDGNNGKNAGVQCMAETLRSLLIATEAKL
eukprot:865091-Rhodomonas_salina.1